MQGSWTGTYRYIKHPNPERIKNGTKFKLEIFEYDGVNFKGIVIDDIESGGLSGEGTIEGMIKNGKIEFVKQMPVKTLVTPKGIRIEVLKKHKPIYYTGIFKDDAFQGEWKIKGGLMISKYFFGFGMGTKGTWEIKKTI